ncbi:hypothetical protein D3C78_18940 [compost metagenome]
MLVIIVRDVINSSLTPLSKLGLAGKKITRIWTIINETSLQKIGPIHNVNAFLEERIHDWRVHHDNLHFYGHSGRMGQAHDLFIEFKEGDSD